jgi:hypothetical protein
MPVSESLLGLYLHRRCLKPKFRNCAIAIEKVRDAGSHNLRLVHAFANTDRRILQVGGMILLELLSLI